MAGPSARAAGLAHQGEANKARVLLKDGRAFDVRVALDPPRPLATLIGKSSTSPSAAAGVRIRLTGTEEVPQDAQLTFSLRAQSPATFTREMRVEVSAADGASTVLDGSSGAVTLQNSKVAVVTLNPSGTLGSSAFGPLRFRLISEGVAGDWKPLAVLVRLPQLRSLECPGAAEEPCVLTGVNLFLLESVAADADFAAPVGIPDGFPGQSLQVPRPVAGQLFIKLRDDPSVVSIAAIEPQSPPAAPGAGIAAPIPAHEAPGRAAPQ
jgi:hypothetical protein